MAGRGKEETRYRVRTGQAPHRPGTKPEMDEKALAKRAARATKRGGTETGGEGTPEPIAGSSLRAPGPDRTLKGSIGDQPPADQLQVKEPDAGLESDRAVGEPPDQTN